MEPLVLAESIPHLTDDDHRELERIQTQIEQVRDVETFLVLDRQLHALTYDGCQVEFLRSMARRFWNQTQHYRRAFATVTAGQRKWVIDAEHRLLIDAIKRRDSEAAESVLAAHIRRTLWQLEQHPEMFAPAGALVEHTTTPAADAPRL